MNPNIPSSYKNYLPSRNIRILIGILVIIGVAYFFIPWAFRTVNTMISPKGDRGVAVFAVPTTDPLTRDTSGSGIPDWELLAVGIDPHDPNAAAEFNKIKNAMSPTDFSSLENQTTDTDKVSLAIFGDIASDAEANDGISGTSTAQATGQEVLNYIAAQKAKVTQYNLSDLTVVLSSLSTNEAYSKTMKAILADNAVFKDAPTQLKNYLTGTADKSTILPALDFIENTVTKLKATPVPGPAAQIHLAIVNELEEMYEVINAYDPTSTDQTAQISTESLIQDDLINLAKSEGDLGIYFSVSLDPKGYDAQ